MNTFDPPFSLCLLYAHSGPNLVCWCLVSKSPFRLFIPVFHHFASSLWVALCWGKVSSNCLLTGHWISASRKKNAERSWCQQQPLSLWCQPAEYRSCLPWAPPCNCVIIYVIWPIQTWHKATLSELFLNLRVEPIVPSNRQRTIGIKSPSVWTDSPNNRMECSLERETIKSHCF